MVTLLFMHKAYYVASQCNPAQNGCDKCLPPKAFPWLLNANMPGKSEQHIQVILRPTLPIGVHAKVELKSSNFYWAQSLKSAPRGFTIGVKAENENIFFKFITSWPSLVPKAE